MASYAPDDILTRFEPWLQKTARSILSPSSPDVDDLVQEGRLALWNALETYNPSRGALPSWLTYKARYRMLNVVQGKPWTGQPPRFHGKQGIQEPKHMRSLDTGPSDRSYDGSGTVLVEGGESRSARVSPPRDQRADTEAADLAYHDDEMKAALSELTQRARR